MKNCNDVDLIRYIDGVVSKEDKLHIDKCKYCSNEIIKIKIFNDILLKKYVIGMKISKHLDNTLQKIELSRMEDLPDKIKLKINMLKEKNVMSIFNKILGRSRSSTDILYENIFSPNLKVILASPKNITKTRKKKKNK